MMIKHNTPIKTNSHYSRSKPLVAAFAAVIVVSSIAGCGQPPAGQATPAKPAAEDAGFGKPTRTGW
jgi:hypothetical protein